MDACPTACAACAVAGFIVDKVPLFPLLVGVAMGLVLGEVLPALAETTRVLVERCAATEAGQQELKSSSPAPPR